MSISLTEELRWLEYGQRLATRRRLVTATARDASCGEHVYRMAADGGGMATGRPAGRILPGLRADLVVIDGIGPLESAMDRWIFAGEARPIATYVSGTRRWQAEGS